MRITQRSEIHAARGREHRPLVGIVHVARGWVLSLLLVAHCLAVAQVDQSWQHPTDGSGGSTPPVQGLLAIVGAVALGLLHLRIDSSLERAVVAAFVGAMLGSLVGWPISCMLR